MFTEAGSWNFGWHSLQQLVVQQMMYLLSGLALGMILLNSAAAIVISFMLPTIFSILVNVISWLRDAAPWLGQEHCAAGLLVDGATVNGTDWPAVSSLWWIWIPMLAGIYRVMKSEVRQFSRSWAESSRRSIAAARSDGTSAELARRDVMASTSSEADAYSLGMDER